MYIPVLLHSEKERQMNCVELYNRSKSILGSPLSLFPQTTNYPCTVLPNHQHFFFQYPLARIKVLASALQQYFMYHFHQGTVVFPFSLFSIHCVDPNPHSRLTSRCGLYHEMQTYRLGTFNSLSRYLRVKESSDTLRISLWILNISWSSSSIMGDFCTAYVLNWCELSISTRPHLFYSSPHHSIILLR